MENYMSRIFNDDEKTKLKELINDGVSVISELETLKEGLKDTVKSIAEELDMKPATINRAIRSAYKMDNELKREELEEVDAVLVAAGRSF
jgi:DNA-binding MarR family transcriptional regulator